MSARGPGEIWQASSDEGQRRVDRSTGGQVATGFVGVVDVMLGVTALAVLSGALMLAMPEPTAHALGSIGLGIGLAFIVIGRSELFTENFLVPVTTVAARRRGMRSLVRLWALTLVGNLAGLLAIALVMTLLTWLTHAAHDETAKVAIALAVGFVLAAPSLNHAVVS